MMERPDSVQIHRWQDAVARDPGSPAFLPLAEVYRREGRTEVARRLCIRGLERHPDHVEAHFLLGRLYRESDEMDKAFDEWDIALRLEPGHRAARRALGYLCLERRDWTAAVRHLESAAAAEPGDPRLASALSLARRRAGSADLPEVDAATALAAPLDRFVREARVRLAFVMDAGGRILLKQGFADGLDMAALASLGAGVHSASQALARTIGQSGFEQLYQGQGDSQIFLARLASTAGDLLLVAVFGADTTIGLVRVVFGAFAREVGELPLAAIGSSARVDADSFEAALQSGLRSAPGAGPLSSS